MLNYCNNIQINKNALSSTLFLTNAIHLYSKNDNIYMWSFILLNVTSILYHQTYNKLIKILDKIVVYNIVYQGGYRTLLINNYNWFTNYTIFIFLIVLYLYYFKINTIQNHCYIHLLSSITHHMIILNKKEI